MLLHCCPPPGCNAVVEGARATPNGLESSDDHEEYTLMTIDEIINGKVSPVVPHPASFWLLTGQNVGMPLF